MPKKHHSKHRSSSSSSSSSSEHKKGSNKKEMKKQKKLAKKSTKRGEKITPIPGVYPVAGHIPSGYGHLGQHAKHAQGPHGHEGHFASSLNYGPSIPPNNMTNATMAYPMQPQIAITYPTQPPPAMPYTNQAQVSLPYTSAPVAPIYCPNSSNMGNTYPTTVNYPSGQYYAGAPPCAHPPLQELGDKL